MSFREMNRGRNKIFSLTLYIVPGQNLLFLYSSVSNLVIIIIYTPISVICMFIIM